MNRSWYRRPRAALLLLWSVSACATTTTPPMPVPATTMAVPLPVLKLAISEFTVYSLGSGPVLQGAAIADDLATALAKQREIRILEQIHLDKIFSELKLQHSGLVAADQITRVKNMLGADGVIIGTAHINGNLLRLNARVHGLSREGEIAESVTGQITEQFRLTDELAEKLAGQLRAARLRP